MLLIIMGRIGVYLRTLKLLHHVKGALATNFVTFSRFLGVGRWVESAKKLKFVTKILFQIGPYAQLASWLNFEITILKSFNFQVARQALKLVSTIFYQIFIFHQILKNYEKCFLFHKKSSFLSRDIQICVFFPFFSTVSTFKKTNDSPYIL